MLGEHRSILQRILIHRMVLKVFYLPSISWPLSSPISRFVSRKCGPNRSFLIRIRRGVLASFLPVTGYFFPVDPPILVSRPYGPEGWIR